MWIHLAAVITYLSALAAVGYWRARRVATGDEFLVAERSLPAHVLVFTLLSTWIGSGSLFAGAGLGYRVGMPALWQSAGAWLGLAMIFFIAPRVRRLAQYSVPDILDLRYGSAARVLGTITIVLAYTTIAAYQFRAGGRLLNLVAGLNPFLGAAITAVFCVIFTTLAGMSSVARLDIGNGVMMLVGMGVAAAYLIGHADGVGGVAASLRPDQLTVFGALSPGDALALFLPTMCLLLGEANMYQKFFSARDERAARLAVIGWIAGTLVLETLIVSIGMLGSISVPGLDPQQSETIVIRVALDVLPSVFGALLLAAGVAIIVSTANSMLLTPATNLVRDVYQRLVNPGASDHQIIAYTRLTIVVLAVIGLLAGALFPTILSMALWAYTMYGAGITPALLAALVWPRATREAGLSSIAAGMVVTLGWEIAALMRGGGQEAYPLGLPTIYPALFMSSVSLFVVSMATRRGEPNS